MNLKLVLFSFFIRTVISYVESELLIDYFRYTSVPSVVGFTCNNSTDRLTLVKKFSEIGVMVSLKDLNAKYTISRFAFTNYYKIGIFINFNCFCTQNVTSLLSEASQYRMYDELHHWLVFCTNIENVTGVLDDTNFGFSTNFVIVVPSKNKSVKTYDIYDVYNIWKYGGANLNITHFGSWSVDKGLNILFYDTKLKRRSNMHGLVIRSSFFSSIFKTPNMSLENYLQDYSSNTKDGLSKYGFSILKHLSELFNFKLQCAFLPNWEVGDATGPMIRALHNNEIDITGSPPTMNIKRTYLVKYIHQSWPFRTCFIFRSPQPQNIKINELTRPFENNVWYSLFILFKLSFWVLVSVFRNEKSENAQIRYSDAVLVNVGAVCQQGSNIKMTYTSTRIAFYFILISNFLIYNYYSASIVSARLNEPVYKLNDSLSELSKLNMKLASEWMVYFEFFVKKQDWETKLFYIKRWLKVPESEQFIDPDKALRLVQKGDLAYHMHPDVGYPIINRLFNNNEVCELTEIHLANPTYATFAVQVNSTFEDMMRIGLIKISEIGLRKRQLSRWTSRKPQCIKNILSASSLKIYEFAPHLLILIFGIILASILCIMEMILTNHNLWLKIHSDYIHNVWVKKRHRQVC